MELNYRSIAEHLGVLGTFDRDLLEKTLRENADNEFKYRIDPHFIPSSRSPFGF